MVETIENKILNIGVLETAIDNIQGMSKEEYALARKDYFGASDSSILLGVNLYKDMPTLIKEKKAKYLTQEEKEVGEKPIVKKGYDLEPIILDKAEKELGLTLHKPKDMFKFKNIEGLSVNYDGVAEENNILIPVEAKLVSKYGEKYYNKLITIESAKQINIEQNSNDLMNHIKRVANRLGIPPYYYTQVQQEIMGLDAPYGYLIAMFDESWSHKLYYIPRDNYVIESIKSVCKANINKIREN